MAELSVIIEIASRVLLPGMRLLIDTIESANESVPRIESADEIQEKRDATFAEAREVIDNASARLRRLLDERKNV